MKFKPIKFIALIITLAIMFSAFPVFYNAEKADTTFYSTTPSVMIKENIETDAGFSIESGTVQGACTDGKYIYMVIHNGKTIILKYDAYDFSLVDYTSCTGLDHANDLTYNSKTGKIVVANNIPNYDTITTFDPETLKLEDSITIDSEIYSIAYNQKTDSYVVGLSGTYDFAVLDSDFKVKEEFTGKDTGYTRQGCDCDENYIYFAQSDRENLIVIYDYEGNFIDEIGLGDHKEVENIFHIGNNFYTTLHYYGNFLYRIALSKESDITYKVNFNANGGKGEMNPVTVIYGEEEKLPKCKFTKENYHFKGWVAYREYDKTYLGFGKDSKDAEFLPKDEIINYAFYDDECKVSETTKIGNVTFYAFFVNNQYAIFYDKGESDTGMTSYSKVDYDTEFTVPRNTFTKNGYVFSHYILSRDVDNKYYGYLENSDTPTWLSKDNISKYYEVKEGEKFKSLTFDSKVTFTPVFKTAYILNENKSSISKYEGIDEEVNIPNNEKIVSIEKEAFTNSNIKKVNLSNNIKKIEEKAFYNCDSIKEICFDEYFPSYISDKSLPTNTAPAIYMNIDGNKLFLGFLANRDCLKMIQTKANNILKLSQQNK